MSAVPQKTDPYTDLLNLPENLVVEIIGGEPHAQPRPAGPHALAASSIGRELYSPFQKGRGGPGGWWIIDEPEIHFVRDLEILVPDLAGWRRERMPSLPQDHRFEVVPDWICEVLSPGTMKKDRMLKMKVYARQSVAHLCLVDPLAKLKNKGQPRSGETGMFFMPPRRARAGRLAGGWRDNAVRRQTARLPDSPSSHLRAS